MRRVILASASPRRRELLEQTKIPFEVQVSAVEEKITSSDPARIVEELSEQKADAVYQGRQDGIVLGADTVVAADHQILGKPKSKEEAASMLKRLQGQEHQVYTGVTLLWNENGRKKQKTFSVKTDVFVYPMTEKEILEYIETGEPVDKAGSYAIQGIFAKYIREIRGDYNNVVGLPVSRVFQELKEINGGCNRVESRNI